jgi:hypothetical protein
MLRRKSPNALRFATRFNAFVAPGMMLQICRATHPSNSGGAGE